MDAAYLHRVGLGGFPEALVDAAAYYGITMDTFEVTIQRKEPDGCPVVAR